MITNQSINPDNFLDEMYQDNYFPDHLVDKCKDVLIRMCEKIEETNPKTLDELYVITHASTEEFNDLEEEFNENDSEIETAARECIASEFYNIASAYGFEADIEELIAPREW